MLRIADRLKVLQAGSLHAYLGYVIALVLSLVLARLVEKLRMFSSRPRFPRRSPFTSITIAATLALATPRALVPLDHVRRLGGGARR